MALRSGHLENFTRAAPGEGESRAAVAIIVNDGAAVDEAIAFDANA